MHELSFAEQIVDAVKLAVVEYPNAKVTTLRLRAGQWLALEPASLKFCLDTISINTVLEGAEVQIEEVGPELICQECGRIPVEMNAETKCPTCGLPGELTHARELIVEEIELDDEESTD